MIKLALKDLRLFFADWKAVVLSFAVPIALITLFAFAFGGAGQDTASEETRLIIADEDNTQASKDVISLLDSAKSFRVVLKTAEKAEELVKKGDEAAVLIFHKGFSDSLNLGHAPLVEFKYDAAKDAEIGILQGALTGSLSSIIEGRAMAKSALARFDQQNPHLDPEARKKAHVQIEESFSSAESGEQPRSILKATPLIAEEETSPGLVHAVAGTAIMMLLFTVVGVGGSLLDEKQEGTLKKLLYSPLHPDSILFGKMVAANVIAIIQLLIMFVYAWLAFRLDIFSHLPGVLVMILMTSYACSSFGVLLASFSRSRQQVQGLSTLIILVMSCLGGSMIPTFIMPLFMQKISVVSVNYWGIQGFYDIFWRAIPMSDPLFLSRVGVLFGIGTVLNLLALQLFRRNILNLA